MESFDQKPEGWIEDPALAERIADAGKKTRDEAQILRSKADREEGTGKDDLRKVTGVGNSTAERLRESAEFYDHVANYKEKVQEEQEKFINL